MKAHEGLEPNQFYSVWCDINSYHNEIFKSKLMDDILGRMFNIQMYESYES